MFRFAVLLSVSILTGCATTQDRFCNLVDNDSYFLVAMARCETLQVSFEQGEDIQFSSLRTYTWMPSQARVPGKGEAGDDGDLQAWVTDAVDAKLALRGFELNDKAPDFLVGFNVPADSQGELSLEIVLAESHRFAWRGTAHDTAYPARDPAAREQRVRIAVGRLLEEFPPESVE